MAHSRKPGALFWLVAALAVAWTLGAPAPAHASAPTEAALFARLGRIQSLSAAFVQTKTLRIFTTPQRSEGRLSFSRDGSLVWEYTAPQRNSLTIEGDRVTMSYPDLGRSEEFDLSSNPGMRGIIESMFLWLKADPAALRKDYDVTFTAAPEVRLNLVPKAEGIRRYISSFTFTFGDDLLVRHLEILEPDGDRTEIEFTSQQVTDRPAP